MRRDLGRGNRMLLEVDAVRPGCECNVQPIVDQNPAGSRDDPHQGFHQIDQWTGLDIRFANLDVIDSGGGSRLNLAVERVDPAAFGKSHGPAQATAIGHETQDHCGSSKGDRGRSSDRLEPKRSASSARAAHTLTSPRPVIAPRV